MSGGDTPAASPPPPDDEGSRTRSRLALDMQKVARSRWVLRMRKLALVLMVKSPAALAVEAFRLSENRDMNLGILCDALTDMNDWIALEAFWPEDCDMRLGDFRAALPRLHALIAALAALPAQGEEVAWATKH